MGPLVHTAAMQQCAKLLRADGINVKPGGWIANMQADTDLPSHGYSFETGTGTILQQIEKLASELKGLTPDELTYKCQLICHLCVDSFSVGQLSSELWGKYDNRMDIAGEFVGGKKKYGGSYYLNNHINTMARIYLDYKEASKSFRFLFSGQFKHMVRQCVYLGAIYAYTYITEGLKNDN